MLRPLSASIAAAALALAGLASTSSASRAVSPLPAGKPSPAIVKRIPALRHIKARPAPGTYAGVVGPKKRPSIGLVIEHGQVVVYICDGRKFGDWFGGPVVGRTFNLRSAKGTVVTGTVSGKLVKGTLTLPHGKLQRYTAKAAVRGKTGLFLGSAPKHKGKRWIATKEGLRATGSDCVNYVTAGCTTHCSQLEQEQKDLQQELNSSDTSANRKRSIRRILRQYSLQLGGQLGPGGVGCIPG